MPRSHAQAPMTPACMARRGLGGFWSRSTSVTASCGSVMIRLSYKPDATRVVHDVHVLTLFPRVDRPRRRGL